MTIYIDNDFKCHASPAEGLRAVETYFFDGKCATFIEGYRFIPDGSEHMANGKKNNGGMISPWKPYSELAAAQRGYEEAMTEAEDMRNALEILGVSE